MSLTVITEMLKCEIESNAGNSFMLSSNSKSFHSDIPFIYSADDEYLSMDEVSPHTPRDTSTPTSSVGSSSTISNQSIDSKKVLTSKESIQLECGIASLSLPTNNNTIHLPGERISSKLPSSHGNHHNNNNPPSTSTSSQNSPIPPAPSSLSALFGSLGGNGSQMPLGSPNVSGKMLQSPSRGGSFTASQLPSLTGSKDTSFYSAHSVSCMSEGTSNQLSLLYDLQCALQQLGLFVEMGLIFGKVTLELTGKHQVAHSQLTKNLSCPSDSSEAHDYEMLYNAKLCDIISVIEKVQLLTQRMQIGSTSIVWDIDELKAIDGDFLVYDDMLLLIMISSLTQLIPHATNIHIKVTISSLTQSSHNTVYKNVYDHIAHNRSKGNLLISFEVRGDSNNLLDMFQQFHCTSSPSSTTQDMYDNSNTSNNSTPMADLGSSIFAFGYLLKNISGSSSFLSTASGGIISFSLPCHIVYHSLINPASPSGKNHSILGLVKQRSFSNSLNESLVKRQSSTNVQLEQSLMSHISNATLYLNASSDSVDDIDEEEQTQSLFLDDFDLERSLSNIQDISASSSVLTKSISNVSLNNHFFPTTSRENSRQLSSRNGLYFEESYDAQKLGILGEDSLDYSCYGDKLSRSNLQSMATKKLKVLMIDDSVTVQKIMNVWLKKKQCEVTQALNGLIGLELLQSQTFDIVLLDFLMPVMDGLTCMQHYHKWRVEHNVQITPWIIGLSATALEKDQELAFEAGLTFFSNKPVDMTALGYILECRRIGLDTLHVKFLMEFTKRNVLDDSQEATWRNILQLSEIISGGGSSHHEQDQKKPKAKLAKKAAPIPNTIFGGFQSYML